MSENLESALYGKWIEGDEGVTISVTTVNLLASQVEADVFTIEGVMLKDVNTTVIKLRHIESKALFEVTWEYQEEEKNNGE